jgi:hypothetical protein
MSSKNLGLAFAAAIALAAPDVARAQSPQDGMGPGMMMQEGGGQQADDGRIMGGGKPGMPGPGMEHCMMMHQGMGSGMMGGQMGRGMMMRPGMMGPGMRGPGMMQGSGGPGMGALFGSRVRPVMNLSVDDVRGYLAMRLDRLNNKRLKIGDIKSDDATITADIVTVDNSLVQQLKVDRHTGAIDYVN